MGDIFPPEVRSRIMSRIKGKDSRIEVAVRTGLWRKGYRYYKHYGKLKIDIAFPRRKVAVFIDSCFWHACPEHGELPKSNVEFWRNKLSKNVERDLKANRELEHDGWVVVRVWEHNIESDLDKTLDRITKAIESRAPGA